MNVIIHTENDQTVTVTRDDPDALLALIESLTEGQMVTAEWRSSGERAMVINGPVVCDIYGNTCVQDPWGLNDPGITEGGALRTSLHSVTATRPTTVRWERDS